MAEWVPLLIVAVGLGVAGSYAYRAWTLLRWRRVMAAVPTSATGNVGPGPVEVHGRARPATRLVTGRLSGEEGVMAEYRVQEVRSRGRRRSWTTVHESQDAPPFLVDDGTGPVLVDPALAEVEVEPTYSEDIRFGVDPSPRVLRFLNEEGIAFENALGANKRMKYRETLIRAGDDVYVLGHAQEAPAGSKARYAIRESGPDAPFLVSNRDEVALSRRTLHRALGMMAGALGFLALSAAYWWLLAR